MQLLLDSALDPVIEAAVTKKPDRPTEALLDLKVIDPACGSGHFLLGAARRIAARIAREQSPGAPSADDYRHALREVARHCLYGVDRNPLAVELCKVALWIETVEPGKPLSFLDASIRCGDSLLGVFDLETLRDGIPDAAYKPLTGDDKETAKHFAKRNKADREGQGTLDFTGGGGRLPSPPPLASAAQAWRALPEDSLDQIIEKRRRYDSARNDPKLWAWRVAADLYIAAFLIPKTGGVPANRNTVTIPTTSNVWQVLSGGQPYGPLVARAQDLAGMAQAFHWPLEFPDVMGSGGFDCVLGNPPWERVKLQEQEFFATRAPEIATAANKAAREKLITTLTAASATDADRRLYAEFQFAKREADAASLFARSSGRYPLTGAGDVNTYALFAEHFGQLARLGGMAGVIVPTGIAIDATTAPFFAALIEKRRLVELVDFENRKLLFPAIHSRMKFSLLSLGHDIEQACFGFFLTDPAQANDERRRFILSPEDIAQINPNSLTAPVFRSQADAELTKAIYLRVPILIADAQPKTSNAWGLTTHTRLWHMAEDVDWFRSTSDLVKIGAIRDGSAWVINSNQSNVNKYVPLYEAKMVHHFDHRFGSYGGRTDDRGYRVLPETTIDQYSNQEWDPDPFYWVPESELRSRLDHIWQKAWLLGWKDVTSATNERTAIFALFPKVAMGHSAPLLFSTRSNKEISCLIAVMSSLVLDYVARQKIGGLHLTYGLLKQLPVPPPSAFRESDIAFTVPRVLELTYTSWSMKPFAEDLGYTGPPFRWDEGRRALLRAELDAWIARLYGLTRDELRYILDPADVMGPDYPSETFRVLKENEKKRFGEYRTQRLVLDAWDAQERGEIRDTSPSITIDTRQAAAGSPPPALPDLVTLPNDAWARTGGGDDLVLAQLAALIRALPGPTSIADVRCAALYALEPRYLTGLLAKGDRTTWCRLVGPESAVVRGANIAAFAPTINAPWRNAVTQLRGMKALIEDVATQTWAAGPKLDEFAVDPKAWAYGRAAFALRHLQSMTVEDTIADLAVEDQEWVRSNAA